MYSCSGDRIDSPQPIGNPELGDEFEKEMELELESRAKAAENQSGIAVINSEKSQSQGGEKRTIDDDECDSDEDYLDDWDPLKRAAKKQQTNRGTEIQDGDPFYDPNADDEDQEWVNGLRSQYSSSKSQRPSNNPKPLPNSDAVLNCPACFAVLTLDCQRHETYQHQYRAMFVFNCTVDHSSNMHYPEPKKKGKKKRKQESQTSSENSTDLYNPVKCNHCSTQVAVFDEDEVYHFFNIVASYT